MFKRFMLSLLALPFFACNSNSTKTFAHWKEPFTGMEFILIPNGSFKMGNPLEKVNGIFNESAHNVTLTNDFWLGQMEVTREQWEKVMGNNELHPDKPNPFHDDNPKYPIVCVSYFEVQDFLKKLDKLSQGNHFRLPTEAEWEYACRAGTNTNYSFGDRLNHNQAKFRVKNRPDLYPSDKIVEHPAPVGSYPPNQWGLFDMHGNVWEWVDDWFGPYPSDQAVNQKGPQSNRLKVIRGGSWYFDADNARSYSRRSHEPEAWGFSIGFRVVREKR